MKPAILLVCLLSAGAQAGPAGGDADLRVARLGDSLVDVKALTIQGGFGASINGKSFQQDALVSHNEYQYLGFYDAARRVCMGRRRLPDGAWEVMRFGDYDFTSNDAHNTISIGVCPADGTIHLAFDHHGHPLHYRVSRKGAASDPSKVEWTPGLFGPIVSALEQGKPIGITYPRFWQTPAGALQFCYRRGGSGNGDRMLVDYHPGTGLWTGTRQIDSGAGEFADALGSSSSRCSYPNGYNYGPRGRLHATWVWRESASGANHDLVYVYSEDGGRTWKNNRGDTLDEPPGVNSPDVTVVPIGRDYGLMNTHGQAVDPEGRIHVVVRHCTDETLEAAGSRPGEHRWGPPEAQRYHHYWRAHDGQWRHRELPPPAGNRPKIFLDSEGNAFLITNVEDNLHILGASAKAEWADWRLLHVEKGPFVNEMLGDLYRWQQDGVLSVMVQGKPDKPHDPTALRVLDFSCGQQ